MVVFEDALFSAVDVLGLLAVLYFCVDPYFFIAEERWGVRHFPNFTVIILMPLELCLVEVLEPFITHKILINDIRLAPMPIDQVFWKLLRQILRVCIWNDMIFVLVVYTCYLCLQFFFHF